MLARFKRSLHEKAPRIVISILFLLFMLAYLSPRIFITIPAGEEAVLFRRLLGGTDVDRSYQEGLRLFFPWDTVTRYNVREQVLPVEMNAISADGLGLKVTVTVRFQPRARLLGTMHTEHGPDYNVTFLAPEVESVSRHILGTHTPSELYSTSRNLIEDEIERHLRHELRQFDSFDARFWPQPYADLLYDGEVANHRDENAHVRLILKHLYEKVDADTALTNGVRRDGFIHLFERFIQGESDYEKTRLRLRRSLDVLDTEIEQVNRDLSMARIKQNVKRERSVRVNEELNKTLILERMATLDSLRTTHSTLEQIEGKLNKDFRDGDRLFEVMKESYDAYFTIIELKDVLISDIVLPDRIKAAIQSKLEQEQVAQEFDFRLDRERKEAERKRIEGKGISDFQDMVAVGIEEGLLKWKAIEATLELAKSPNAKMVIIGAGKDGLPIILGNQGWDFPKPMVTDGGRQAVTTDTTSAGTPKE